MLFNYDSGKLYIDMIVIYAVVGVIAALALFLFFRSKAAKAAAAKTAEAAKAAEPVVTAEAAAESEGPLAPGSAGKLKLYDTPPKTAAMVMAIVADQLKKPINELRFISIKEVC